MNVAQILCADFLCAYAVFRLFLWIFITWLLHLPIGRRLRWMSWCWQGAFPPSATCFVIIYELVKTPDPTQNFGQDQKMSRCRKTFFSQNSRFASGGIQDPGSLSILSVQIQGILNALYPRLNMALWCTVLCPICFSDSVVMRGLQDALRSFGWCRDVDFGSCSFLSDAMCGGMQPWSCLVRFCVVQWFKLGYSRAILLCSTDMWPVNILCAAEKFVVRSHLRRWVTRYKIPYKKGAKHTNLPCPA